MKQKTCRDCKYFTSHGTLVNKGYDGKIEVKNPIPFLTSNLYCSMV